MISFHGAAANAVVELDNMFLSASLSLSLSIYLLWHFRGDKMTEKRFLHLNELLAKLC